ncbi:hypothetical protein OnM2_095045 [Erysiphe neolycopersici]|uniref:Uncharacterized protein n=1 Tax=Erysiphe neolycopersici TaxID=212602 RepID=A0A420HB91_9PEZI|nr:hypothetical protein OnM2_095045 [Erysiphe neolycopersici]
MLKKEKASYESSHSDDKYVKNLSKATEKDESMRQEDNNCPDKDDLANCDDSNQEIEEEKLSDRNSQNSVNKNENSLKNIPSIGNAAKEKKGGEFFWY